MRRPAGNRPDRSSPAREHDAARRRAVQRIILRDTSFYESNDPPAFTATSLARCYAFLLGSHPRCGKFSLVQRLPHEIVCQICQHLRQPINDDGASTYHFVNTQGPTSLSLWMFVRKHKMPRIVLQHVEVPEGHSGFPPLVTRFLGWYEGYTGASGRTMLVKYSHKIETTGLALCDWPAACSAAELHATPIVEPPTRRLSSAAVPDPCMLELPRLPSAATPDRAPSVSLDVRQLSFSRSTISVSGGRNDHRLERAEDSAGDPEDCFLAVTACRHEQGATEDAEDDLDELDEALVRLLELMEARHRRSVADWEAEAIARAAATSEELEA